jgi:hypothetical protein
LQALLPGLSFSLSMITNNIPNDLKELQLTATNPERKMQVLLITVEVLFSIVRE